MAIVPASDGAGGYEASSRDEKAEDVAACAKYDTYWARFKVDDERVQSGQPVNQGTIRSLVLWTRQPDMGHDDNECLNREAQRSLKRDKKLKDKEKDKEQEMDKAEDQDPEQDNNTRAKPKAKAKAKGKAAAKMKAKAKAKGKARAKPHVSEQAKSPANEEDESSSLDLSDSADDDAAQAPMNTIPSPAEEEAPTKDQADESEPPKKRRRRPGEVGHVPSFARRVCPKTRKPAAQWCAIKDTFNSIVRSKVAFPSSHEEFWLQG